MCDANVVITCYARLFRNPGESLSAYDDGRLEQGIWFVVHSQLSEWLWDDDIAVDRRLDCIAAMPTMFRDFLIDRPLKEASWMWWDMLRSFDDAPDPRIVDGLVRALAEVLQLPARHCRMSALHGLGHLRHSAKEEIIRAFLSAGYHLDAELLKYAESAIKGTVL